jgi:hypothetical protein
MGDLAHVLLFGSSSLLYFALPFGVMAERSERIKHVQSLRRAAKKCGVELIHDGSGRSAVQEFAAAIQSSRGPQEAKR